MPERSTIYEVARRSGVSTATVSRVMRGGTGFSESTRQRVLQVAGELGWVPNGSARGLAVRRAGIVGLLFPDLVGSGEAETESPLYVDQVIRGAERAATAVGDAVLIAATRGENGRELAYSVAGKVDGLVLMARSLPERDVQSIARSLPVVLLAEDTGRTGLDYVGADNRGGMAALAGHLVQDHGYTDLAFIGGPEQSPDSIERFKGFRQALRGAGLPVPAHPDGDGGFTERGGALATLQLISCRQLPQAIVYGNDEMALGGLAVLRGAGHEVPAQVAVTGFDDITSARHIRPPLTTVHQPMRDLGERAVRLLLTRISHQDAPPEAVVLPTELVLRRSCGCNRRPVPGQAAAIAEDRR